MQVLRIVISLFFGMFYIVSLNIFLTAIQCFYVEFPVSHADDAAYSSSNSTTGYSGGVSLAGGNDLYSGYSGYSALGASADLAGAVGRSLLAGAAPSPSSGGYSSGADYHPPGRMTYVQVLFEQGARRRGAGQLPAALIFLPVGCAPPVDAQHRCFLSPAALILGLRRSAGRVRSSARS